MKWTITRKVGEGKKAQWIATGETFDDVAEPIKDYLARIKTRDGFDYKAERQK